MTAEIVFRDVDGPEEALQVAPIETPVGRSYIAAVGIDRYRGWNRLHNAVSDAAGAVEAFLRLGFDLVRPSLFNEEATGDALRRLVTDDLASLGPEDSLVLFFAGHGHTVTRSYHGGTTVKDGYLIPADGDPSGGRTGTWLRLESWLTEITRIPAKHILVVLDACHSGLALGPIMQWRNRGAPGAREPLDQLRARRSRRIITSALDDQLAMDGGPMAGHSLFTGCLIEALTGGLVTTLGESTVTGSEIAHYVQRRVSEYPGSVQTPDFGALELDDRGELVVHIAEACAAADTPVEIPDMTEVLREAQRAAAPATSADAPPAASHATTLRIEKRTLLRPPARPAPAPPSPPPARIARLASSPPPDASRSLDLADPDAPPLWAFGSALPRSGDAARAQYRRELVARTSLARPVVGLRGPAWESMARADDLGDPGDDASEPRPLSARERWAGRTLRWGGPALILAALLLRLLWELRHTSLVCQ